MGKIRWKNTVSREVIKDKLAESGCLKFDERNYLDKK